MSLENPIDTWPPGPPEIPPLRPPDRPAPKPILPSWLEPDPAGLDRDVADRLLEQRVIVVGGRLDDSVANRVAAQLLLLDARETDPITLHLACTDAELEASLACETSSCERPDAPRRKRPRIWTPAVCSWPMRQRSTASSANCCDRVSHTATQRVVTDPSDVVVERSTQASGSTR
jgi:hypothetical protein